MSSFSAARAQAHLAEDISSERRIVEKAIQALNTAIDAQTVDVNNDITEATAAGYLIGGDIGKELGSFFGKMQTDIEHFDVYDFLPEGFNPIHFNNIIDGAQYDADVYYYSLLNKLDANPGELVLNIATAGVENLSQGRTFAGGDPGSDKATWNPIVRGIDTAFGDIGSAWDYVNKPLGYDPYTEWDPRS